MSRSNRAAEALMGALPFLCIVLGQGGGGTAAIAVSLHPLLHRPCCSLLAMV